ESLLAGVVDVGEAEQVPAHLARGVVAAILARGVDARDPERLDLGRLGRLAAAREIEELAVEIAGDAPRQLLAVERERARQARDLLVGERELARIHPDRIDRRADRERLAVAVGDGAAVGGDLQHAREARVALAREETVIDQLQVHRAPQERRAGERQQAEQDPGAPAERARRRIAPEGSRLHGVTTSMFCGGGIAMCSRVLATRSTNAWLDQALCSSCSWPHSICRLSRRALSASSWMKSSRARCSQ